MKRPERARTLAYQSDLACVERAVQEAASDSGVMPLAVGRTALNPTLRLVEVSWRGLARHVSAHIAAPPQRPEPGREVVMAWADPWGGGARARAATDEDLLVLKVVAEGLDPSEVAAMGGLPESAVDEAIGRAVRRGIVLSPTPIIRRDPSIFSASALVGEEFLYPDTFTLQWHLTQRCDLHCRHCYDRGDRAEMSLDLAMGVLEDLRSFCRSRRVGGHISFSGGNPLLYPHFIELYRAASEMGFGLTVLGNPTTRERVEEIAAIQPPYFYQVSLEGLPGQNDSVRGEGHYARAENFLRVLRETGVSSMVMLTLTSDNVRQVVPLAERLRGLADDFHFNRLSRVGEGAALSLPARDGYAAFLEEYLAAAEGNPVMGLKDNLINIIHYRQGTPLFGGCTGFGCGAAFNFLAVLPDGEAHACRKFPSSLGNVLKEGLAAVYGSEAAARYRAGCEACRPCPIRPVCGGCLAGAHGHGLDIFTERDPFCFFDGPMRQTVDRK